MSPPTADAVLLAWERGRHRHPLDRSLLLYALAAPEEDPKNLADRPLGERNRALLGLRGALFGDRLSARVDCPSCTEPLEFELSAGALLSGERPARDGVELDGLRFRLPTTRDLAAVAHHADAESAMRGLVALLAESTLALEPRPDVAWLDRLEAAFESADPQNDLSLSLTCSACSTTWTTPFDVASYLWVELEGRAQRLLDDVHHLARAYGWSEREILNLTEERRSAYLERALA
jgi:hypothetical protein